MSFIGNMDFISEDKRTKKYLMPKTVVKAYGHIEGESNLLMEKSTQIALSEPIVTALENNGGDHSAVLLDFGCELHGGVRILTASNRESMSSKVRITFGESIAEATS
jgi:hypothetical protein